MSYDTCNCDTRGELKVCAEPIESLIDMMKSTRSIANDVLSMARKINSYMFGIGNPVCEKETDPRCFRDDLSATRCELSATAEELAKILSMLGL